MSRDEPLISDESAVYLARVVNRAAMSFDVAALSGEEAMEVYMLFDRFMSMLWREHQGVLLPLFLSMLEHLDVSENDEPEGSGGDSN